MSTKVYEDEVSSFSITRFFGGSKEGVCAQFSIDSQFAQFNREKILSVIEVLKDIIKYEDERRIR